MKARKTRFEQVPVKIAENALRLQPRQSTNSTRGRHSLRNPLREAHGHRAHFEPAHLSHYFQEDQMTPMVQSNSPRPGTIPNPGRFSQRRMVWIKTPRMEAWACCACAWAFQPSGPPVGDSLEEMMRNYELHRDAEYASHICEMCPKGVERSKRLHDFMPGRQSNLGQAPGNRRTK